MMMICTTLMYFPTEEQEQIFNPDCRNDVLLDFIKRHCQCGGEDVVELSDERGVVKNLRSFPQEYAKEYLRDRETLILLRVDNFPMSEENGSSSNKAVYTPLLSSLMSNPDFIDILNPPKDDDTLSEISSKSSRRRSSTFEIDDFRSTRSKGKVSSTHSGKKPGSRRGQRAPLRKSANTSS
ncbi:uncharacterized protein LOC106011355 isoform X1 [Aplysia californica]|uniref:Uncharacterized protein LOC106011355 isoform X1 n=1 Tax=Aplysia californica TaxID=6500 RepID=A0ABM0ZWU3_APLCA|nr:uncharacterized protein LOC106011355 isoform X1 [Aplysia californica]